MKVNQDMRGRGWGGGRGISNYIRVNLHSVIAYNRRLVGILGT